MPRNGKREKTTGLTAAVEAEATAANAAKGADAKASDVSSAKWTGAAAAEATDAAKTARPKKPTEEDRLAILQKAREAKLKRRYRNYAKRQREKKRNARANAKQSKCEFSGDVEETEAAAAAAAAASSESEPLLTQDEQQPIPQRSPEVKKRKRRRRNYENRQHRNDRSDAPVNAAQSDRDVTVNIEEDAAAAKEPRRKPLLTHEEKLTALQKAREKKIKRRHRNYAHRQRMKKSHVTQAPAAEDDATQMANEQSQQLESLSIDD